MRPLLPLCLCACGPTVIPAPPDGGPSDPVVLTAIAFCAAEDGLLTWTFGAEVRDDDGDVVEVNAFVYDEVTELRVHAEVLAPTDTPDAWATTVDASATPLDCTYRNYSVDLVATDARGATGFFTVWATPLQAE